MGVDNIQPLYAFTWGLEVFASRAWEYGILFGHELPSFPAVTVDTTFEISLKADLSLNFYCYFFRSRRCSLERFKSREADASNFSFLRVVFFSSAEGPQQAQAKHVRFLSVLQVSQTFARTQLVLSRSFILGTCPPFPMFSQCVSFNIFLSFCTSS